MVFNSGRKWEVKNEKDIVTSFTRKKRSMRPSKRSHLQILYNLEVQTKLQIGRLAKHLTSSPLMNLLYKFLSGQIIMSMV